MEDRPHLVLLGHGAELSGPPVMLGHLVAGLAELGRYDLTVVSARRGPLLDRYREAGATVVSGGEAREPLPLVASIGRRAGAERAMADLQARAWRHLVRGVAPPDLVYVNGATPPTAALLRALDPPPDVPVVLHVHELDIGLRLTLDPADLRFLLGRADHLIGASRSVTELLVDGHGVDPDRIDTCEEFVDPDRVQPVPRLEARARLGIPADAAVVGSVGYPDWRKDPEHLVRAVYLVPWLERVQVDHPDLDPWVVWIGGDPGSLDGRHLADEARRLGLAHRLVHVGHTDRPDHLLGALDVFALPSREDALPLAALEAAAAGLPIVSFRTGGVGLLCDEGGAGIAVDHPDTAGFASAIVDLLTDVVHRAAYGQRGAALVRSHHSPGPGVARIGTVIETVLDRRRAPHGRA